MSYIATIITLLFVSYTFRLTKTVYVMLYSVLVLLFVFMQLITIEFEFFAISVLTVYVGGIAVMFLFLIITVDLKEEAKPSFRRNLTFWPYFFLALFVVFVVYWYLALSYDPKFFDPLSIINDIRAGKHCPVDQLTHIDNVDDRLTAQTYHYTYYFMDFTDINILGWYCYRVLSPYVVAVGLFLFIATLTAVMLCTNSVKIYSPRNIFDVK